MDLDITNDPSDVVVLSLLCIHFTGGVDEELCLDLVRLDLGLCVSPRGSLLPKQSWTSLLFLVGHVRVSLAGAHRVAKR